MDGPKAGEPMAEGGGPDGRAGPGPAGNVRAAARPRGVRGSWGERRGSGGGLAMLVSRQLRVPRSSASRKRPSRGISSPVEVAL